MADSVLLRACRGGVRLRLRVKAGARHSRLVAAHNGALKLEVTDAPRRGKANAAVTRLLADHLGVPASAVSILSGETSRDKLVEIAGLVPEALADLLGDAEIGAVVEGS